MQQPAVSVIDILDRVLDKGLVVAGDISISLANVELLTIRIRLLVCSIDKAEQIGLNWWRYDRNLVASAPPPAIPGVPPRGPTARRATATKTTNSKRRPAPRKG
ncbi:MAG: gas vesicle protein [Chloroflexi bacterium]|nr:gas vesicle protein [Chloroflexota bacterium]